MNFDVFVTEKRWELLAILSESPASPLALASRIGTSVSYVSQQLKLLEAAGIVVKNKTGSAEKGKPRSVYSLTNEILYLTALTQGWATKKLLYLTDYHQIILRIWGIDDPSLHRHVERFYWALEALFSEVEGFFYHHASGKSELIVVSESKKVQAKAASYAKDHPEHFRFVVLSRLDFVKKSWRGLWPLYDPDTLSNLSEKKVKGGNDDEAHQKN